MTTNTTERDAFEAWARTKGYRTFERYEGGENYCNAHLNGMYIGYKAGRAALASPATVEPLASNDEVLRVARLIENLKRDCGTDPESMQAIRNGQYMSIAAIMRGWLKSATPQQPAQPDLALRSAIDQFGPERLARAIAQHVAKAKP